MPKAFGDVLPCRPGGLAALVERAPINERNALSFGILPRFACMGLQPGWCRLQPYTHTSVSLGCKGLQLFEQVATANRLGTLRVAWGAGGRAGGRADE